MLLSEVISSSLTTITIIVQGEGEQTRILTCDYMIKMVIVIHLSIT